MNCKQVRDLLITDYIDGELDKNVRNNIDKHVALCQECKEFARATISASEPFKNAEKLQAPDDVWQDIKERIRQGQQPGILDNIVEKLSIVLRSPKPAFVLATVCAVVLIAAIFGRLSLSNQAAFTDKDEEAGALFYLAGEYETAAADMNGSDYETDIEKYLL